MKSKFIKFNLTPEQKAILKPLFDQHDYDKSIGAIDNNDFQCSAINCQLFSDKEAIAIYLPDYIFRPICKTINDYDKENRQ